MKYILLILLLFFVAFSSSCGGGTANLENQTENTVSVLTSDENFSQEELSAIVGGVFGQFSFDIISGKQLQPAISDGQKAATVGFDATVQEIDHTFNFLGIEGGLDIVAVGTLETILSNGATGPVFYFDPLYLDLSYNNFSTEDELLGTIKINGNAGCYFKGRYEEPIGKLIGSGECSSGTLEEESEIGLTIDNESHKISFRITFKVYGAPFEIESYQLSGHFSIDGSEKDLSEIFPQ